MNDSARLARRRRASTALVVAAAVSLVLALVLGYAWRAVFDTDQFTHRADHALESEPVQTLVAEKLTDEVLLKAAPDAIAARPLIEELAASLVGSKTFASLFRSAARDLHRSVFVGDKDTVTLTVVNAAVALDAALKRFAPKAAAGLPEEHRVELLQARLGSVTGDLTRTAERLRTGAIVLTVLGLLALVGAVVLAPDRRRLAVQASLAVAGAALLLFVAYGVGRAVVVDGLHDPEARAAAGAVWDAYLLDLRNGLLILAGAGAVAAAAVTALARPVSVEEPLVRAWRSVITAPASRQLEWVRAFVLVGLGLLVLFEREFLLQLILTLTGLYLLYLGLESLLRLIATATAPRARVAERRPRRRWRPRVSLPRGPVLQRAAVAAVAGAVVIAAVAVFAGSGGASAPDPEVRACNGHAELCDRPFDQVFLPATHNSMSVPLPGWFSSEQDKPIGKQLKDGIRGLLIDTHYGVKLENGRVKTDLGDVKNPERAKYVDGVGPQALDAALKLRDKLGFAGEGKRGMYLCHTFCELGATSVEDALEDVRDFLATHPHEVVVLVNQDAVRPADFAKEMKRAGLTDFVYEGPVDGEWPTLREMIERGERLVVFAEEDAGKGIPWYHLAYDRALQETPFEFKKLAQLRAPGGLPASCKPNRGRRSAPLFLLNHWITSDPLPRPSDAAKVNARERLLARVRECRRLRGKAPQVIAVNFYKRGDLFGVVDELNRVR